MKTWGLTDFARAMESAVRTHALTKVLRQKGAQLQFNGFWRGGDNQNVCLWLDKATWHDAKTGKGGGCKEFAKTVFNMNLSEFMERFGSLDYNLGTTLNISKAFKGIPLSQKTNLVKPAAQIFNELCLRDREREDRARIWLESERGFIEPRFYIGSCFANLFQQDVNIFDSHQQKFIQQRVATAAQIIVPLRGVQSDRIQNLFFRSMGKCSKEEKSRLLPNGGGWHDTDSSPRAFGFPHLINDFPHLLICEGMADYFTAECLLDCNEKILPIGASNADGINKWAQWLVGAKYKGRVSILHQLDLDENGEFNTKKIGPFKAIEALKSFADSKVNAQIFDWPFFLKNTTTHPSHVNDIADILSINARFQDCSFGHLQEMFSTTLTKHQGA